MHWTCEDVADCVSPRNLSTLRTVSIFWRTTAADKSARMILGYPILVHFYQHITLLGEKRHYLFFICLFFFLSASAVDEQLGYNQVWACCSLHRRGQALLPVMRWSEVYSKFDIYQLEVPFGVSSACGGHQIFQMVFMERLRHLCLSCSAFQNTLWLDSLIADATRI